MENLFRVLSRLCIPLLLLASLNVVVAQTTDDERYLNLVLLDSPSAGGVKLGARQVNDSRDFDVAVLDVIAEKLHNNYRNEGFDDDALSWLAKTLGNSGNARYRSLLTQVSSKAPSKKLRKYASSALTHLRSGDAQRYELSASTLSVAREWLAQKREANPDKPLQREAFSAIVDNASLVDVLTSMGYPEAASSDLVIRDLPRIGKRKMQQLLLKYKDVGLVRLTKPKANWQVLDKMLYPVVDGKFPVTPIDYKNLTLMSLLDELWTWDVYVIKAAYRPLLEKKLNNDELDLIAHRLWLGMSEEDPFVEDGLAYLGKLIAASKNPRYALIMREVADNAVGSKLRKYGGKAARVSEKLNKKRNVEQLQPLRALRPDEIRETTVDKLKGLLKL